MATVSQWTPFGVALDITATAGTVTRTSATQYTVKINVSWKAHWNGAETNYGMKASSGGGSVTLNPSGTYSSGNSGSFTGTYSISGGGSATKTITVTFTNYIEDWQGNVTDSATKTVSFDVTVPAVTYTVTFVNGLGTTLKTQTVSHGSSATPPSSPTRTGYTFNGWSGTYTNVTSNRTITATWAEHKLTVNYYSNYATSAFADTLNAVGSDKNVKVWTYDFYYDNDYSTYGLANYSNSSGSVHMTRTGHTGTGNWGTTTSGGTLINENTGYSTGQALAKALGKDLSSGNASINLYAQWTPYTHTVSYNGNGGSGVPSNQTKTYGGVIQISSTIPTRSGYKFVNWNTEPNGTGTPYASNQTYGYDQNGGTVVLYAIWEVNVLTIKYHVNGGKVDSSKYYIKDNLIGLISSSSVLEDKWNYNTGHADGLYNAKTFGLNREGYKFIGWKIGANGTIIFDQDDATIVPTDLASNLTTDNQTVTLYAVWEISGVVYIDNGITFEPYLAYIDNGTKWEMYLMYIDDGSNWNIIS